MEQKKILIIDDEKHWWHYGGTDSEHKCHCGATHVKRADATKGRHYYKIPETTNYLAYSGSFETTIAKKDVTITLSNVIAEYPESKTFISRILLSTAIYIFRSLCSNL